MIIECVRCRTRYRFDARGIESDGVWVRCSRCRHVFFQELPYLPRGVQQKPVVAGADERAYAGRAARESDEAVLAPEEFRRTTGEKKRGDVTREEWEEEEFAKIAEEREEELMPEERGEEEEGRDEERKVRPWAKPCWTACIRP